jgi:hypothetical protein
MEPIMITIEPGGTTYPDNPHEGEEIGYVIEGTVTIIIGNNKYQARKGESFYIKPDRPHYLANNGKKTAKGRQWMADEELLGMLTMRLPVIGYYCADSGLVDDYDDEIPVNLGKIVGLSTRRRENGDVFVVSVLCGLGDSRYCDNLVTTEGAYGLLERIFA